MQAFPADMSASDLSELVFDRPDWAPLVLLFACLLRAEATRADTLGMVVGPHVAQRVQELTASAGHAVSPASVLKDMRARPPTPARE